MNPVAIGLVWLVSLLIVGAAAWQNGNGAAKTECTAAKVQPLEQSIQTHNQGHGGRRRRAQDRHPHPPGG